jgi:predicted O-methyltransferase YrrM
MSTLDLLRHWDFHGLSIPGWFSPIDQDRYHALAAEVPPGALIVEIGVFGGLSLLTIAEGCRDRAAIIGIDLWDSTDRYFPLEDSRRRRQILEKIIATHHLPVELRMGDSHLQAMTFDNESIDLVFVDADHEYEAVKADIAAWWPKVKHGGVLAGHDYDPGWPGVERAIRACFAPLGLTATVAVGGAVWCVRKP